jgi:CBS domain-containing protein
MLRHGGEALGRVEAAAGQALERSVLAVAEGQRCLTEEAAEQVERVGQTLAEAVQQGAHQVQRLMVIPQGAEGGLRDLQQALSDLVEGVARTNLRAIEELVRLADPSGAIALQQRFVRDYLDALIEGGATILRATQRTAEETLRPLERQLEERQQQRRRQQARTTRVRRGDEPRRAGGQPRRHRPAGGAADARGGQRGAADRDVAVRLVAEGRDPVKTKVREVMTPEVRYVFEDEELGRAADAMAEQQVRRLPVVNRDKRLVGIVSLGDLATAGCGPRLAGRALGGVAREGGPRSQAAAVGFRSRPQMVGRAGTAPPIAAAGTSLPASLARGQPLDHAGLGRNSACRSRSRAGSPVRPWTRRGCGRAARGRRRCARRPGKPNRRSKRGGLRRPGRWSLKYEGARTLAFAAESVRRALRFRQSSRPLWHRAGVLRVEPEMFPCALVLSAQGLAERIMRLGRVPAVSSPRTASRCIAGGTPG